MLSAIREMLLFITRPFTSETVKRNQSESSSGSSIEGMHKLKRVKLDNSEYLKREAKIISLNEITKPDIRIVSCIDSININENELINHKQQKFTKDFSNLIMIRIDLLSRRISDSSFKLQENNKEEAKLVNRPNGRYDVIPLPNKIH
jgi:hypothetical protein